MKAMYLYHSTTSPLMGKPRTAGNCGFGAYFARLKSDSKVFGFITYKAKISPQCTLTFNDNEVKGKGFFNMSKEQFDEYISQGYDSIAWYKGGKLKEFIVLNSEIIIEINII